MAATPPDQIASALQACLAATDTIVALYDPDDVLRFANASFERRFLRGLAMPVSFGDVLRNAFANKFGVHVASGDIEGFIADVLTRRRAVSYRAFEVDTLEGEWIYMTETLVDGWLLGIGSVITRLKDHERVLRHDRDRAVRLADTDALTGVLSRGRVLALAEDVLASCGRTGCAVQCRARRPRSLQVDQRHARPRDR